MDFYPVEPFDIMNLAREDETSLDEACMDENEAAESSSSEEELDVDTDDEDGSKLGIE